MDAQLIVQAANNILQWAEDRNLIEGSTPKKQITKTIEEIGEVAAGLVRSNHLEVRDGIGDVFVTLTIASRQMDTDYTHSFLNGVTTPAREYDSLSDDPLSVLSDLVANIGYLSSNYIFRHAEVSGMSPTIMWANVGYRLARLADSVGEDLTVAVATAWNEIKDRKGRMINGVFVKEADLPVPVEAPTKPRRKTSKKTNGRSTTAKSV